jgi:hypothetical protein
LIQRAAQLGFGPARDLVALNYLRSEAMQSVVPAADAVRYTITLVTDEARESEDSKTLFAAFVDHAVTSGTMHAFAGQVVNALWADQSPRLSHRVDVILDLLAPARGGCSAVAQIIAAADDRTGGECSSALKQSLLRYIQLAGSRGGEQDLGSRP